MKIWNSRNQKINQKVDTFLSGEDINLDNEIFIFDVDASIAHTEELHAIKLLTSCLLYTSPSPRDATLSRMPSSA